MGKIALISIISILGYLFIVNIPVRYLKMKKEKNKKNKESIKLFNDILFNLINGKTSFYTRYSSLVYINTTLNVIGEIQIIYNLNESIIYAYKGNDLLSTLTKDIDAILLIDIITHININYNLEMSDIVVISGIAYSKKELMSTFNKITSEFDIKKMLDSIIYDVMSSNSENKGNDINTNNDDANYNIDELLDKINTYGINSLTNDERKYLDNQQNK